MIPKSCAVLASAIERAVADAPDDDRDLCEGDGASDEDTLRIVRRLLRKVEDRIQRADPVRFSSLVEKASNLVNRVEQIQARRPRAPTPDEVHERIRTAAEDCTTHLLRHTREAAAKLASDRADLASWASAHLGPAAATELRRRIDAMLGGAP